MANELCNSDGCLSANSACTVTAWRFANMELDLPKSPAQSQPLRWLRALGCRTSQVWTARLFSGFSLFTLCRLCAQP